jgi:hypothetical protein
MQRLRAPAAENAGRTSPMCEMYRAIYRAAKVPLSISELTEKSEASFH